MNKYNGKPMSHWEAEAKSLVMDVLIKAAIMHQPRPDSPVSIISELASKQLYAIATGIDPRMAQETRDKLYVQSGAIAKTIADLVWDGDL